MDTISSNLTFFSKFFLNFWWLLLLVSWTTKAPVQGQRLGSSSSVNRGLVAPSYFSANETAPSPYKQPVSQGSLLSSTASTRANLVSGSLDTDTRQPCGTFWKTSLHLGQEAEQYGLGQGSSNVAVRESPSSCLEEPAGPSPRDCDPAGLGRHGKSRAYTLTSPKPPKWPP